MFFAPGDANSPGIFVSKAHLLEARRQRKDGGFVFIVYRGLGFLVFPLIIACILAALFAVGKGNDPKGWLTLAGFMSSGPIIFIIGKWLNSRSPATVRDSATGIARETRKLHDVYGIKMEYWGLMIVAAGGLIALYKIS